MKKVIRKHKFYKHIVFLYNLTVLNYAALLSVLLARLSLRQCNFNIADGGALITKYDRIQRHDQDAAFR